MNQGIKRSLKTGQPQMRMIAVHIAANGAVSGFDQHGITATKTATGKYTIDIKYAFNVQQPVPPMAFIQCLNEGCTGKVVSSKNNEIKVELFDASDAPADLDFDILILGNDGRLTY